MSFNANSQNNSVLVGNVILKKVEGIICQILLTCLLSLLLAQCFLSYFGMQMPKVML